MKLLPTGTLTFLCLILNPSEARPQFRDRIPNGNKVPNPFIPGSVWAGVGHLETGGGGQLNPFGLAFTAAGFQWTKELCEQDSDGDGRSNGQELGDPNCVWSEGQDPAGPAVSHPGIVDTVSTTPNADTCAGYQAPSDVIEFDVKFSSPNQLDGSRTQYLCEQFEVDSPKASAAYFHQVKQQPLVQNSDVLHHIWIYSCDNGESSDGNRVGQGTYDCNGVEGNCQIVSGWALGMPDICEPGNVGAGVYFGSSGKSVFKVEAHYDNAAGQVTTDQSGMRMHLTTQLRPLEAGQIIVGMDYYDRTFELEAGQTEVRRTNICPTAATIQLKHPLYVYTWNPHMHLYGRKLITEHYRCGQKIGEIGNMPQFEFDNQQSYILEKPIKLLPGDSLVTTCSYDTSSSSENVLGGEQTTEEMCDNYLAYYPNAGTTEAPNFFTACISFEQGLLPQYNNGFDDYTPFAIMDLGGELYVDNHESDPANNIAPCCADGGREACEALYLANANEPCGIDQDCKEGLVCSGGLCSGPASDGNDNSTGGNVGTSPPSSGAVETKSLVLALISGALICFSYHLI